LIILETQTLEIAKYFSIMLASMLKFFGGPIAGFLTGVPIQKTILLSAGGMMLAVILTTIFAKTITNFLEKRAKAKKQIFTSRARFSVKIWQKLGLFGIALLTPVLFTPIGGTLMALSFRANIFKMIGYMLISSLFWGYLVSLAIYELRFISEWLMK
jgi:hypothetical protein